MYQILFENSWGNQREIGVAENWNDAFRIINSFLKEKHYKSYYSRYWEVETNLWQIDVGSHTEFFYIKKVK